MRVLIEGRGPAGRSLARLLAAAGHQVSLEHSDAAGPPDAVVLAVSPAGDLDHVHALRAASPGTPLLVLTRIALPWGAEIRDIDVTLMFPGANQGSSGPGEARPLAALAVPGPVLGPFAGPPRAADRQLVALLRSAGIRVSLRADMQPWLTVTSAWLGPLRGAIAAAARQGLSLDATPDLVTVAARAARERLRLLRGAGLSLPPGCFCLLTLPEAWAIATVRRVASALRGVPDVPWIPDCEEAAVVAGRMHLLARENGIRTPAADFLDGFSREEASRSGARGPVARPKPGAWKRPGRW